MSDDHGSDVRTNEAAHPSNIQTVKLKYTLGQLLAEVESCPRAAEAQRQIAQNTQAQQGSVVAIRDRLQAAANEFQPDPDTMPGVNRLIAICNERWGEGITPNTVRRLRGAVCKALALTPTEADRLTLDKVADALGGALATSLLDDAHFNEIKKREQVMNSGELVHFDLPTVFRVVVELAEATAAVAPAEWADLPVDIDGPESPHFERWMDRDCRLKRIEDETIRLKRVMGATGPLEFVNSRSQEIPKWESFHQHFANTAHDRIVRQALTKLATAAIDLSGFAAWRDWQWPMRETGLRLLTWGLAQLWEGMSKQERFSVRDRLKLTHKALGWPSKPKSNPAPYTGPEDIPLTDRYRVIDRYISCHPGFLNDVQEANRKCVEQGQVMFLRQATLPRIIQMAEEAAQVLEALAKRNFDTPTEFGDLYLKAFWKLACLRRAKDISAREPWTADALEQRKHLADSAGILLTCVGGAPEAKAALKPEDAEKALGEFTNALGRLREMTEANGPAKRSELGPKEGTTKPTQKRSTERGEGRAKLIAALTKHHRYADGGCLNLDAIGNNELARAAGVAKRTASAFFDKQFQGHGKYRALCADKGRLVVALKLLNGEFAPHILCGSDPQQRANRQDDTNDE